MRAGAGPTQSSSPITAAGSSTAPSLRSRRCRALWTRSAMRCPFSSTAASAAGSTLIKALALGARGVLIGRPHLWGVACAGEEGVYWVLELFRREIDRAMALGGWDGVAKIKREILFR